MIAKQKNFVNAILYRGDTNKHTEHKRTVPVCSIAKQTIFPENPLDIRLFKSKKQTIIASTAICGTFYSVSRTMTKVFLRSV